MSPSHSQSQAEVQRFRQFELLARSVVEGSISGRHHSPYKGFAIEFEEHRQYAPGDDLKHLDWKVLGKLSRYYIKQYEEDTTLRAYLVVDISGSMHYTSAGRTKLETARMAAQVLSYLLIQQQDAVGLMTCDNRLRTHLPPRATKPCSLHTFLPGLEFFLFLPSHHPADHADFLVSPPEDFGTGRGIMLAHHVSP